MPLQWTLKKWLAVTHDVYRVADVRRRILEKTGVDISPQALGILINGKPRALRISTLEVVCETFQCKLSDFCEVLPGAARRRAPRRLYPGHGRRKQKDIADFPSPEDVAPSVPKRQRRYPSR